MVWCKALISSFIGVDVTYWARDKMAELLRTTFLLISLVKTVLFRSKLHDICPKVPIENRPSLIQLMLIQRRLIQCFGWQHIIGFNDGIIFAWPRGVIYWYHYRHICLLVRDVIAEGCTVKIILQTFTNILPMRIYEVFMKITYYLF